MAKTFFKYGSTAEYENGDRPTTLSTVSQVSEEMEYNTTDDLVHWEETEDPNNTTLVNEYTRILNVLYQALTDAQSMTTQTNASKVAADLAAAYANAQAAYAQLQGDYAKNQIDGAKGNYDSLNARFNHVDEVSITLEETSDTLDQQLEDEYERVLALAYQMITDMQTATAATQTATTNANTAASTANAAATAANNAMNAAKGSYDSLALRLNAIQSQLDVQITVEENSDPASLFS